MRGASLVISWICWLITVLYWLFLAIVSFNPTLMARTEPHNPVDRLFFYTGIGCMAFAFVLWFMRKRIWFDSSRKVGIGFLLYLFPLYLAVLCAVVGPYLEFIILGYQSLFFKTGFVVSALLMMLVFPRLPRQAASRIESP